MTDLGPDTTTDVVLSGVDLQGKRALVTGASTGLGEETTRALASVGAAVTMAVRDMGRGEAAAARIRASVPDAELEVREVERGSLASIRAFATGVLAIPGEPLNTIVAIQFVPLLAIVGVISAFTYRRTNSYVPGAVICGLFIAWYVTAGTATHWSPDFQLPMPGR